MSQLPPAWGPPHPPHPPVPPRREQMLLSWKFWLAIGAVWLFTFGCTVMVTMPSEGAIDGKAPRPTATASATSTANAKPAPTVTVKVTKTVTVAPEPSDDEDGDTGSGGTHFDNCADARAQGAAPVRRGEPGYGRHLDRDGDGVGCD
jgi:excalibur calcium-binding domain-containing protein